MSVSKYTVKTMFSNAFNRADEHVESVIIRLFLVSQSHPTWSSAIRGSSNSKISIRKYWAMEQQDETPKFSLVNKEVNQARRLLIFSKVHGVVFGT